MGKAIDVNHRFTEEERAFLASRGRSYLFPANERRFGTNADPIEPEDGEPDNHAISPFYNSEDRQAAVYDVGGAPLPNTVLDYNTGRVADRENGVLHEFTGPGHTPGAHDLSAQRDVNYVEGGFVERDDVDDHMDEDIVEHVLAHKNVGELKKSLKELDDEADTSGSREELENRLAVKLQDMRDGGTEPFAQEDEKANA